MAIAERADPYFAFDFLLEIRGLVVGGFTEVTGLQSEVEVQEYREGGLNDHVHKLSGPARYPSNLTLRHGLTDADELWGWHRDVLRGRFRRRNGSIILLDAMREEKVRWNFVGAYPVRWSGPELRAATSAFAVETLELAHNGITRDGSLQLELELSAELDVGFRVSLEFEADLGLG